MAETDQDFLKKIVTGHETGCFLFEPQTKCQSPDENISKERKLLLEQIQAKSNVGGAF